MSRLFRGEFETGIYPDEWHWREGISKPNAAREICNAWKSDRTIAAIVLNEKIGRFISKVMGWESVRIAQDDLVWKVPPLQHQDHNTNRIDTVGFHQDSSYISKQFEPYENNSVTLWIALDDVEEDSGCLEYAVGSHKWRPLQHKLGGEKEADMSDFHSSDESSYQDGMTFAAQLAGVPDDQIVIDKVPVKEGHAILHHQDIYHGSAPNNRRSCHRRALVAHYLQGDIRFRQDSGHVPFGGTTYIYGRYKRYNSVEVDDTFFPIIYGDKRTEWLDDYIAR